jgi:hypothetical protein
VIATKRDQGVLRSDEALGFVAPFRERRRHELTDRRFVVDNESKLPVEFGMDGLYFHGPKFLQDLIERKPSDACTKLAIQIPEYS